MNVRGIGEKNLKKIEPYLSAGYLRAEVERQSMGARGRLAGGPAPSRLETP